MNKHLIVLGITILLICVGLSGCTELSQDGGTSTTWAERFAGTWTSDDENAYYCLWPSVTFYSDYTVTLGAGLGGYYEVKDGKLVITTTDGAMMSYDFTFADNDNKLIVTSLSVDKTATYVKQ